MKKLVYGLNYHPENILSDPELRGVVKPASCQRDDVMHIVFSNGTLNFEMHLFLQSLKKVGIGWGELRDFIAEHGFVSRSLTTNGFQNIFSLQKETNWKDTFKAGATEMLAMYPIVRHWIETKLKDRQSLTKNFASIFCLMEQCDILDSIRYKMTSEQLQRSVTQLKNAISTHLRIFVNTYGARMVKPKHHEMMHIPDQLLVDGICMSCWVTEREK